MQQSYKASTPYVTFGTTSTGRPGGFGGGNSASNIVSSGNTIEVKDSNGNTLYSATAVRNASYVCFASSKLTTGQTYYLYVNGTKISTATATSNSASGGSQPDADQPEENTDRPGESFSIFTIIYNWIVRIVYFIKSIFGF